MTENDYFNSLSDELKKFCEDKNFYPTSDKEFNDFVRSYCELDNLKDFYVEVKESEEDENESTILVPIFCKRPFYAFVSDVWNAMTDVQRVQAIAMAYNYICNEISPRLTKKIQLTFIDSDLSREWLGCFNSDINQMYISLTAILSPYGYASRFLAAIKHELTHAEQYWERKKNLQYVKSQNYDFSKLSSYQKKLFLSGSGEFGYYVDYLYKQVSQGMETTK